MIQRDSPTARKAAIRILITIAAHKQWTIKTTEIKSAFLQGKELSRDVYLRPPIESGVSKGIIWNLRHCLYDLKDGARQFYLSVKEELVKLGCKQSKLDPVVFVLQTHELNGIICCHVDDFLHAGNEALEKIVKHLRQRILAGRVEEKRFKYLEFQINQENDKIILDHTDYVPSLKIFTMDPERAKQKQDILLLSIKKQTLENSLDN